MTKPDLGLSNFARRSDAIWWIATVVFILAIVARIPSCYESFWLDELHSAWSVWGPLEDVASRAAAGNQTPTYFWGLWLWKQRFGESEVILRLPSVLASSIAAALATIGVYRVGGSLIAGITAGLVLALESNALFYGVELRPFAFTILFGTIACYVATKPVAIDNQGSDHRVSTLAVLTVTAAFFQPTSVGVFAWLCILRFVVSRRQFAILSANTPREVRPSQAWIARTCLVALFLILFVLLSGRVLGDAWHHRSQWSEMGGAKSIMQVWQAWPWGSLVLMPALLLLMTAIIARRDSKRETLGIVWLVPLAAFLAVCSFWLASAVGIAPIFHRRYFVACLPMLAWACGHCLALTIQELRRIRISPGWQFTLSLCFAAMPIMMLLATQGTLKKLLNGDTQLTKRGEGWREASEFLVAQQPAVKSVSLSAGLMESSRLLSAPEADVEAYAQWYLTYPLRGPYAVPDVEAVDLSRNARMVDLPVVLRGSRTLAQQWMSANAHSWEIPPVSHSFGAIHVICLPKNGPADREIEPQ